MDGATAEIGIFGGTGLYDSEMLEDSREVRVGTRYGDPSDAITVGTFQGRRVAFLPRHGKKHGIPPHLINFRANIEAFRQMGVTRIIAPSAVGSLREELKPGDFVMPSQYIDYTKSREYSFSEKGRVIHISMADPFLSGTAGFHFGGLPQAGHRAEGGQDLCVHRGPAILHKGRIQNVQEPRRRHNRHDAGARMPACQGGPDVLCVGVDHNRL